MRLDIKLLPYQFRFLKSKSKFVWLCAGLGAGKSFILAQYAISRMLTNPETTGLICAATYSQLRDSTQRELFSQLTDMGLAYEYSDLLKIVTLKCNGARVKLFSLENYEVLRGIEVGWVAIDEACLIKEAAYNVALGRLRCKKSKHLAVRIVSTPRGFDYLYDRFLGEKVAPGHEYIHATAYENFHLPKEYLETLESQYFGKHFRQEVMAEHVSATEGNVYHAFDRKEHAVRSVNQLPGYTVFSGVDFNVNPLTGVLANVSHGSLYVFGEVYQNNSNTFALAKEIQTRHEHDRVRIVPDATGSARKTSSVQSDHEILRAARFEVLTSRRNPPVEDRYNTVNGRLREGRIHIDKDKCPMLVRDLERVTHEDNPDYLTHISDALGYLCWHVFPIKRPRPVSKVYQG